MSAQQKINFQYYDLFRREQDKNKELAIYKTKYDNLQLEARNRMAKYQNQILEAKNTCENLSSKMKGLNEKNRVLEKKQRNHDSDLKCVKKKNNKLQKEKKELEDKVKRLDSEIRRTYEEKKKVEEELNSYKNCSIGDLLDTPDKPAEKK